MSQYTKRTLKDEIFFNKINAAKKISLGTFPFKDLKEIQIFKIMERYLSSGRTFIDTAAFYGDRRVERILGRVLKDFNCECFIATKVGYFRKKEEYQDQNYIYDQVQYSQELIGQKINLLQIHEADWDIWWLCDNGSLSYQNMFNKAPVIKALTKIKQNNDTDYIGITGNNADKLANIAHNLNCIDSVLLAKQYDLLWRNGRGKLRNVIEQKNLFYIVGAPFHQGRLLNLDSLISENSHFDKEMAEEVEKLKSLIIKHGLNLIKTCLEFLLTDPLVDLILVGIKEENELWWLDYKLKHIPDEIYKELLSIGFIRNATKGIPYKIN
ncbi:aldo/keto reductase [Cytobacillus firmus]|uniref:NADP-dependent oxidoreductase domain-containing protein n=5 Tax=Cytobacillus firmus TaxID=1399 RepID=A0A800NAQ2_CYTFI|nr:aldo/keto reductase [Cytobacillus firmus]KAF0824285.1 hypothetical protein KIS1582_1964 [Cytobacillus firmus]